MWFFLPETKNASLEEMDRVFGSRTGEQDAELLREAQAEVGLLGSTAYDKASFEKENPNVVQVQ